jgi:ferredoxin-like protein FixX
MREQKCLHCGSDRLEPGNIQSTGAIYFRPDNAKFMTLKTADIRLKANICLECGAVFLVGDPAKVETLTSRAQPH